MLRNVLLGILAVLISFVIVYGGRAAWKTLLPQPRTSQSQTEKVRIVPEIPGCPNCKGMSIETPVKK